MFLVKLLLYSQNVSTAKREVQQKKEATKSGGSLMVSIVHDLLCVCVLPLYTMNLEILLMPSALIQGK